MLKTGEKLWDGVRDCLRHVVPPESYQTWFGRLECVGWRDHVLQLRAPNRYVKQWIETHYARELVAAVRSAEPETQAIELLIAPHPTGDGRGATAARVGDVLGQVLPSSYAAAGGLESRVAMPTMTPAFTLGGFVPPPGSLDAYKACTEAAEGRTLYNPLVLCGPRGVGKTHLLQGVAAALRQRYPELRILCVSAESFVNGFLRALKDRKLPEFRSSHRTCHALLVDDVHFLANKAKTQEEFVHTFDELLHSGRQTVLTCLQPPRAITGLDPRLAERLQSGLVANLAAPDLDTRMKLVLSKSQSRGFAMPHDAAELLALRVEKSVREIEGAICKVSALATAENRAPDRDLVARALKDLGHMREGPPSLEEILNAVARRFAQNPNEIRGNQRHAALVRSRHVGMYLARQLTLASLNEVGRFFGNRNHASVIHAVEKIADNLGHDAGLKSDVDGLRRVLGR